MNDISMYIKIGNRIKECRESLHMTQEQLAEASGFSISYISRIERADSCPPLETICMIADALNVNLAVLLCDLLSETSADPLLQEITYHAAALPRHAQEHLLAYMKTLPYLLTQYKSADTDEI